MSTSPHHTLIDLDPRGPLARITREFAQPALQRAARHVACQRGDESVNADAVGVAGDLRHDGFGRGSRECAGHGCAGHGTWRECARSSPAMALIEDSRHSDVARIVICATIRPKRYQTCAFYGLDVTLCVSFGFSG